MIIEKNNKIVVPQWFKESNNNAYLNSSEVKKLYGYSDKTNISLLIELGSIPKPTFTNSGFSCPRKHMWKVGDLKKVLYNRAK